MRCDGSGTRTRPTGSSAFPEVKCPKCDYYGSPVKRWDEWYIRAHRVVIDPEGEEVIAAVAKATGNENYELQRLLDRAQAEMLSAAAGRPWFAGIVIQALNAVQDYFGKEAASA